MPNVRCRYYDSDTGVPTVQGGCRRGTDCNFVHPDQPKWATASAYQRRPSGAGRDSLDSDRANAWGQRADSGWAGSSRAGPSRRSPIPTAPRAMQTETGWGSAPIGGTSWSTSEADNPAPTTIPAASSSTSTWGAANDTSWGAPTGGGWGAPTTSGWGEPSAGGWGDSAATTSGASASTSAHPPAPAISPPRPPTSVPRPAPAAQQSPTRENVESIIWGDRKGKGKEVVGAGTPQYGYTPRTPRSPNRSPERDPRKQASSTTAASTTPSDYIAIASTISKEMRQEREGKRLISSGILVPIALAGDGAVSSTSKRNPFAFPAYDPPEKMDVNRHAEEEGVVNDVDMVGGRSLDLDADVLELEDIPVSLTDQWKDYTRALVSAIRSNMDMKALRETRAQLQRLHSSRMYASLSQVAAHARLNKLDDEAGAKAQKAKTRFDHTIKRLTRYPLDGLPPPTDNDPRLKDAENVGSHIEAINKWMAQMRISVEEYKETIERAEAAQRRVEEENRRIEEERKCAAAEAVTQAEKLRVAQQWVPITSTRKAMVEIEETFGKLEERVTDLEYDFNHMREKTPSAGDVVFQRLVELGFCKSTEAMSEVLARQKSLEEGEMPFEPPLRPKSNEELTDECERLEKLLEGYTAVVQHGQQQLTELQERRVTRDRSYHELAADNASLTLTIKELEAAQKRQNDMLAQSDKDIARLEELLERCKNERPPPPPPPPTPDEIAVQLLKTVLPELREAVKQALGKIKSGADDALLKQQEAICAQIFLTLQPAMAIVHTVKAFMDCQPEVLMPPPPPPVQPQSV
ncbi:hypothetical protein OH76DRAFT_1550995 [Lentinus brumalis]|uniref:C3H1-type domain-containing protein n=1 Tax=Lentinus brumalis TaxID=2498619 RepID=A0A371DVH6_9APHY|nr:hypothetical protein OH76DRAFT_1550995 [Polyporus brumalis]